MDRIQYVLNDIPVMLATGYCTIPKLLSLNWAGRGHRQELSFPNRLPWVGQGKDNANHYHSRLLTLHRAGQGYYQPLPYADYLP